MGKGFDNENKFNENKVTKKKSKEEKRSFDDGEGYEGYTMIVGTDGEED